MPLKKQRATVEGPRGRVSGGSQPQFHNCAEMNPDHSRKLGEETQASEDHSPAWHLTADLGDTRQKPREVTPQLLSRWSLSHS